VARLSGPSTDNKQDGRRPPNRKSAYAAKFVAEQAVRLHGGMGMSDELNVGHYFKRISSFNIQFGDPAYHILRYAQQN